MTNFLSNASNVTINPSASLQGSLIIASTLPRASNISMVCPPDFFFRIARISSISVFKATRIAVRASQANDPLQHQSTNRVPSVDLQHWNIWVTSQGKSPTVIPVQFDWLIVNWERYPANHHPRRGVRIIHREPRISVTTKQPAAAIASNEHSASRAVSHSWRLLATRRQASELSGTPRAWLNPPPTNHAASPDEIAPIARPLHTRAPSDPLLTFRRVTDAG